MVVEPDEPTVARPRNATRTRLALLDAARRRFARDGYVATTVRDIANDAGANVSLISRYFESKEGLFEACLTSAGRSVSKSAGAATTLADVATAMGEQLTGSTPDAGPPDALLLLLRTSGDERAEEIRVAVLRSLAERLAALAGWSRDQPDPHHLLLRAQLVLASTTGIGVLRSIAGIEPLVSATAAELQEPLHDLVRALLTPPAATPPR